MQSDERIFIIHPAAVVRLEIFVVPIDFDHRVEYRHFSSTMKRNPDLQGRDGRFILSFADWLDYKYRRPSPKEVEVYNGE